MVIYGEYLFLENFITGFMILHLTRVFSGISVSWRRLLLGSVLCGLYAFLIFVPMDLLPSLTAKLAFSFAVIPLVFGFQKKRVFRKLVFLFYIISFAMGGISIGLMYLFGVAGVGANGALYMGAAGYVLVAATAAAAYLAMRMLADWMRGKLLENRTVSRVAVALGERKAVLLGLVDTGNFLSDPATGKPVFLLSETGISQLLTGEAAEALRGRGEPREAMEWLASQGFSDRLRLIPYSAVGTERGMLLGIRPDYIEIRREGETEMREDVILGLYHGSFGSGGTGEPYGILLHAEEEKGGLVCHG